MTIKPLKDRVVAIIEQPLKKTKSGILLGESVEKAGYAVIQSVGPEVKTIKKGDKVIYNDYSATKVKLDGTSYLIIREEDVLATL